MNDRASLTEADRRFIRKYARNSVRIMATVLLILIVVALITFPVVNLLYALSIDMFEFLGLSVLASCAMYFYLTLRIASLCRKLSTQAKPES